jgi:ribonuclease-3
VVGFIKKLVYSNLSPNKSFYSNLYQLLGYFPANISLYKQALIHNSTTTQIEGIKAKKNNERLEYLGDAVLDSIIAEYLFKKFPFQGEGFLTEMSKSSKQKKVIANSIRHRLTRIPNL